MSRSHRLPYDYYCTAHPAAAKRRTSKALRRLEKAAAADAVAGLEFDLAHPQDRTRGCAGTRSKDHGWDGFGDGRYYVPTFADRYQGDTPFTHPNWHERAKRK